MALTNPRNTIAFDEIEAVPVTFLIDNATITYDATLANGAAATMIGKAVTLSAARTVALAADADPVIGKLLSVESDNKCSVQIGGFMELPGGTAAGLTLGCTIVGALLVAAKGYVRVAVAAESPKARGRIVDASVTTAVVVYLG
jgi:hypothetical protein